MIGAYKKIKVIGTGSLGVVWLVQDQTTGKHYAAKLTKLHPEQDILKDIHLNINIMKKLKSLYFVEYITDFKEDEYYVIIMEYCTGGSMRNLIDEHIETGFGISEGEIKKYIGEVSKGISLLHSENIVHGNIKPENILFDKKKRIKIADVGMFRTTTQLELQGMFSCYESPEQLQEQPSDIAMDVWSLGCVLYELCSLEVRI